MNDKASFEEFMKVGLEASKIADEYITAGALELMGDGLDLFPTADSMPPWWPPDRRPERLKPGYFYQDKEGHWRTHEGRLASRAERRQARLK